MIAIEVAAVLFLATVIRSAFGFGEALVAVPLLALAIPVEIAAPVAVLVSITVALIVVAAGLAAHPLSQRGVACGSHAIRNSARADRAENDAGGDRESGPRGGDHRVLGMVASAARSFRAEERPAGGHFRIPCGDTGRGLRHERTAAGDVWGFAPLAAGKLPRHSAGIFSSRERSRHGGLLVGRSVDAGCEPLLPVVIAGGAAGDFLGRLINRRMNARQFLLYVHAGLIAIGLVLFAQALRIPSVR